MTMQVDKARLDEMLDAADRDMIARGDRIGARLARDLLEVFDAYRSLRSTEGKEALVTDEMVDAAEAVLKEWKMVNGVRTAARLALTAALTRSPE